MHPGRESQAREHDEGPSCARERVWFVLESMGAERGVRRDWGMGSKEEEEEEGEERR